MAIDLGQYIQSKLNDFKNAVAQNAGNLVHNFSQPIQQSIPQRLQPINYGQLAQNVGNFANQAVQNFSRPVSSQIPQGPSLAQTGFNALPQVIKTPLQNYQASGGFQLSPSYFSPSQFTIPSISNTLNTVTNNINKAIGFNPDPKVQMNAIPPIIPEGALTGLENAASIYGKQALLRGGAFLDNLKPVATGLNDLVGQAGKIKLGPELSLEQKAGQIFDPLANEISSKKAALEDLLKKNNSIPSLPTPTDELNPNAIAQPGQQLESQLLTPIRKMANPQTNLEVAVNSSDTSIPSSGQYLKDLVSQQDQARKGTELGLKTKIGNFYNKLKEQLVDSNAPIEDVLTNAEKKSQLQVLPKQDVRLQIDRVLRAPSLAGQFAKDNGLVDVIKQAPDLQALDQYMIAKQAKRVAMGVKSDVTLPKDSLFPDFKIGEEVTQAPRETGRNLTKDELLIQDLAPIYEPFAQKVNQYSRKLLQYSVDTGLISKDLADQLIAKYPEYVPLNRIFNQDELAGQAVKGTGKGIASLSKQSVVQKLEGSTREIDNPIASLLTKTQTAFEQGEKNVAAQQLASYRDLPGNPFNITPVKEGAAEGKTTFSALINGQKQIFQTTPEVAAAAKSLNKEQMGLLAKIVSIPTRVLRLGATGLNYPFAFANLIKDQSAAFINSEKILATSNPINFLKGLWAAVGHGELYQDMVRNAAGGTSFDIGRGNANLAVKELRAGRNVLTKAAYTVTNPEQLIRAAENLIGRTEELTRAQQYKGALDAFLKQGRTLEDAKLLAAQQARNNTTNFARGGSFTKVLSWVIPYFNAGVQGSRTFVRNVSTRPAQTLTKFSLGVGMPVAAATLWNMSDPQRKAAYDDIPDFEKQNSIILLPTVPTKNPDGSWKVIKIPLSQEIASLTNLVRRPIEQAYGSDPVKLQEIANSLFQTATSLNTGSSTSLISSLTPQIAKPGVEVVTNKNLYTGRDIVPPAMRNLPPEQQVKKGTSGTARIVGKALNTSPLVIQNEANTILGGLGSQLLNTSDNVLNKVGLIPYNQVGGKSLGSALDKRFFQAQGGDTQQKTDATLKKDLNPKETQAYDLLHTPRAVDEQGNPLPDTSLLNSQQKAVVYLNYPKLQAIDAIKEQQNPSHDPIWDLPPAERNVVFASRVQLPGQKNTYDQYLNQQPWYKPFLQQQSQYFDQLKSQPGYTATTQPIGTLQRPTPSSYVQQQMDAKNWKDPQVKGYLDALTAYNNNTLAQIGLPAAPAATGFAKKPKQFRLAKGKVRSIKVKALKIKQSKIPTVKTPKLSALTYKGQPLALKVSKLGVAKIKKIKVPSNKIGKVDNPHPKRLKVRT